MKKNKGRKEAFGHPGMNDYSFREMLNHTGDLDENYNPKSLKQTAQSNPCRAALPFSPTVGVQFANWQ